MKATNELSCYRFAVVIHTTAQKEQPQPIQDVIENEWVDFVAHDLSRQALLILLQNLSDSRTITISNIPYSKTIFEKKVVQAFDNQVDETSGNYGWLLALRRSAKDSPSLSATDLEELAQLSGCRVEISWARQYSQSGGLDAIFHPIQPSNSSKRALFRFPTDHQGRPFGLLTNQPLERHKKEKTEKAIHDWLRAKLPSYMVPTMIKVLKEMPINENGKIIGGRLQRARRLIKGTKHYRHIRLREMIQSVRSAKSSRKYWGVMSALPIAFSTLGATP